MSLPFDQFDDVTDDEVVCLEGKAKSVQKAEDIVADIALFFEYVKNNKELVGHLHNILSYRKHFLPTKEVELQNFLTARCFFEEECVSKAKKHKFPKAFAQWEFDDVADCCLWLARRASYNTMMFFIRKIIYNITEMASTTKVRIFSDQLHLNNMVATVMSYFREPTYNIHKRSAVDHLAFLEEAAICGMNMDGQNQKDSPDWSFEKTQQEKWMYLLQHFNVKVDAEEGGRGLLLLTFIAFAPPVPRDIIKNDEPQGKDDSKRPSFFLRDFFNCFRKQKDQDNLFANRWKAALHGLFCLLLADTTVTELIASNESLKCLKNKKRFFNNFFGPQNKAFVPVSTIVAVQHLATVYLCKHTFRALKENMTTFCFGHNFSKFGGPDYLEKQITAMGNIAPPGKSLEDLFHCNLFGKLLWISGKNQSKEEIPTVRKDCMFVPKPQLDQMIASVQEKNFIDIDRCTAPLLERLAFSELVLSQLFPADGGLSFQQAFGDQGRHFQLNPVRNEDQPPLLSFEEVSGEEAEQKLAEFGVVTNDVYRQMLLVCGIPTSWSKIAQEAFKKEANEEKTKKTKEFEDKNKAKAEAKKSAEILAAQRKIAFDERNRAKAEEDKRLEEEAKMKAEEDKRLEEEAKMNNAMKATELSAQHNVATSASAPSSSEVVDGKGNNEEERSPSDDKNQESKQGVVETFAQIIPPPANNEAQHKSEKDDSEMDDSSLSGSGST